MEEGEPAWMRNSQQNATQPAAPTQSVPSGPPPTMGNRAIQMGMTIVNLGLMIFVSATGALAMKTANSVQDTGVVFVSFYLILFAAVLGVHELINLTPGFVHNKLDSLIKLNFGFLYSVYGKSCYEIFIGVLIFALAQNDNSLALPCAILVVAWAIVQILVYLKFPQWFTNLSTYEGK